MFYQSHDTIVTVARQRAVEHPDRNYLTFLQDGDANEALLSYGELDRSARRVAAWLQKFGLARGDRALIMLPNGLELTQILFGCFYAGVLAVPQPQQLQAYLKTFIPTLNIAKPKLLIATSSIVDFVGTRLPPVLKEPFSRLSVVSVQEVLSETSDDYQEQEIQPSDTAYLQFTSGSTGDPKGVMVGHRNIMANMEQARIFGNWEEGKGTSLWLPLFHDFGLAAGMLGAMYNGGFVVLMTPAHFMVKPWRWLSSISKYRCEYSYAPPFGYDLCIRQITPEEKSRLDLSCLVSMVYGAEPVHYSSVKRFNGYFAECGLKPSVVRPGFGMAETVIMFSESSGLGTLCADRRLLETQGKLRLIDETAPLEEKKYLVDLGPSMVDHEIVIKSDENKPLPEGEVGEIVLSGPSVCQGYYENPEATRETFQQRIEGKEEPFLSTGDLGLMWEGKLYFTGRIKDIIIIRGRNYFPQDIEHAVPQGKEIRSGCVIAYAASEGERAEQLVVAMEIQAELMMDMDMFLKYVLPAIDKKVTTEIGQQFQIRPDIRLYLRPGTLTKTSSGKIKHHENIKKLSQPDFKGLVSRLSDISEEEKEVLELQTTVMQLFEKIVGTKAVPDAPILPSGESSKIAGFIEAIEEKYPVPGLDVNDIVDETTTLNEIMEWLEEQLWSGMIPM
ncbi:MAG: fatty acyl-AMP ligase [Proteobacteria bacterium]|nr:fatty acyl-AMP ligase [Pseudomonadota bacterium]